jgi:hypothetical protein
MRKRNRRPPCRKIVLKLPDLDHAKSAVLNSLSSPHSPFGKKVYDEKMRRSRSERLVALLSVFPNSLSQKLI